MANRLANETSPYLLQHKDNPVDWYPWGEEALSRARQEDRPIFLSIGYSSCHWCHVMERESFENHEIAAQMNREFINIKVDREERPDIDSIYMAAVQAVSGHGGWPMSVFLLPDGRPFFAGTYFPPEDRPGMPGFPHVLESIARVYREERERVDTATQQIIDAIRSYGVPQAGDEPLPRDLIEQAYQMLPSNFDSQEGGFARAPKFPQPQTYEFLLRHWKASPSTSQGLLMVDLTLEKMARGGIYDQVGGGFHRYSTDEHWLVPHFEKMLYDNAQLATLYLHGWLVTGRPLFSRVVEETLEYVLREMTHEDGGFYSAQDADSEGEEGKFFVWSPAEIDEALGTELGQIARMYYAVTEAGNFEGKNILHVPRGEAEVAEGLGISTDDLERAIAEVRAKLLDARERRVRPGLDDKVLVSWNGLMLKAFAECGAVLERPEWLEVARRSADFLLRDLVAEGRLLRSWRAGHASPVKGYLEDHAFLADGLLSLYEATFEQRWLDEASRIVERMVALFWEPDEGIFYDTGRDHEELVVRPRDIFDNATSSGSSAAAFVLLRLAGLTDNAEYREIAMRSMRSVRDWLTRAPTGFANWLAALDFGTSTTQEVVIIGPREDAATKALLHEVYGRYAPNRVMAGAPGPKEAASIPLLEGRGMVNGSPTAYVCRNMTCELPVTDPVSLAAQLDSPA